MMNIVLIRRCNTNYSLPEIFRPRTFSFLTLKSTMSKVWDESMIPSMLWDITTPHVLV